MAAPLLVAFISLGAGGKVMFSDPQPNSIKRELDHDQSKKTPETFNSNLILTEYNPLQLTEVRPATVPKLSPPGKRPAAARSKFERSQKRVSQLGGGAGGKLASIRQCESRGDYGAISSSGKYRGAYQFDAPTHRSVGGDGDASDDSPAEQDAAAARLLAKEGPGKWPNCGRR